MASHLDKDPPIDDLKERRLEDDARLFLQIRNSINGKVLTLINLHEFFFLSVKSNILYKKEKRAQSSQKVHNRRTRTISLSPIPQPSQKLHQRI